MYEIGSKPIAKLEIQANYEYLPLFKDFHLPSDKSGSIAVPALSSPPRHAIKHEQYE